MFSFFIPEEGAPRWVDSFMISRDSPKRDEAHQFIDFMCEPKVAAMSSNYLWYATPNEAALDFLDEELRDDKTIYPKPEVEDRCPELVDVSPRIERAMNLGWSKAMSAASARVSANSN